MTGTPISPSPDPFSTALNIASVALPIFGGIFGRKDRKNQKREEDRYLDALLANNQAGWDMNRSLTIAKRDETIRSIDLAKRNDRKFAAFKDANAQQAHQFALSIWKHQNELQDRQYARSEELYQDAISLNARSADAARDEEMQALQEEKQKYAFQNEASIIQNLVETGTLAASGIQGRSAAKAAQSQMAELGRNQAIMTESLVSANRSTRANLRNISLQHEDADNIANARRMLKPIAAPKPLAPIAQPLTDYEYPRELQDFDFGPTPIRGQSTIQVPSWGSVFANAASQAVGAWSANYTGTAKNRDGTNR
tara:strand:+ start:3402 stop:4334 length:933 start_codon:yes stop_codon:yes gene_type:complete